MSQSFLENVKAGYLKLIRGLVGDEVCASAYSGTWNLQRMACVGIVSFPLLALLLAVYVIVDKGLHGQIGDGMMDVLRLGGRKVAGAAQGAKDAFIGIREGYGAGDVNTSADLDVAFLPGCEKGGHYYQVSPERCVRINRVPNNHSIDYVREKRRLGGGRQGSRGEGFSEGVAVGEVKGKTASQGEESDLRQNSRTLSPSLYRRSGKADSVATLWQYRNTNDKELKKNRNPIDEPPVYHFTRFPNDPATRAGLSAVRPAEMFSEGAKDDRPKPYIRALHEKFSHNPHVVTDQFRAIYESAKLSQRDLQDPWKVPRKLEGFRRGLDNAAGRCRDRSHGGVNNGAGGCRQLFRSLSEGRAAAKLEFSKKPVSYVVQKPFNDPRFQKCVADCASKHGKVVGQINVQEDDEVLAQKAREHAQRLAQEKADVAEAAVAVAKKAAEVAAKA